MRLQSLPGLHSHRTPARPAFHPIPRSRFCTSQVSKGPNANRTLPPFQVVQLFVYLATYIFLQMHTYLAKALNSVDCFVTQLCMATLFLCRWWSLSKHKMTFLFTKCELKYCLPSEPRQKETPFCPIIISRSVFRGMNLLLSYVTQYHCKFSSSVPCFHA